VPNFMQIRPRGLYGKCVKYNEMGGFFLIDTYAYTVVHEKVHDYFYNNFGECGPIFTARSVAECGIAKAIKLSVRPSICL